MVDFLLVSMAANAVAFSLFMCEGSDDKVAYHFDCDELKPSRFLHIGG